MVTMLTMKALRKMKRGPGLSLEKMLIPSPEPVEVLVRVKTASICGTDLHIYGWDAWSAGRIKPPVTLGHEFCGVVERVGREVAGVGLENRTFVRRFACWASIRTVPSRSLC